MRVLIIGGTGFIGTPLAVRLRALGHDIAVFSRGEKPVDPASDVVFIRGDRQHIGDSASDIDAFQPEVVVDIFAMTEVETGPVFDLFAGRDVRFVMLSSCDVYRVFGRILGTEPGPILPEPIVETSPLREKLYPYRGYRHVKSHDYDKIPLEKMCLDQFESKGTVLRLPMIIGPGDKQHRFRDPVKHMADGRLAILLPSIYAGWKTTYGYIGNVVEAIACAALDDRAGGHIFNVADKPILTSAEGVAQVAETMNWPGEIVVADGAALPDKRAGMEALSDLRQDILIHASKIKDLLGFEPRFGPEESLQKTIEWERAHLSEIDDDAFDYAADDAFLASRKASA